MSSYRYDWTENVKWMIRNYPHRIAEAAELGPKMPPAKLLEYKSVAAAIEILESRPEGLEKLRFIRDLYWAGSSLKPLNQAATDLGITEQKCKQWQKEFIWIVAKNFGYLFLWE